MEICGGGGWLCRNGDFFIRITRHRGEPGTNDGGWRATRYNGKLNKYNLMEYLPLNMRLASGYTFPLIYFSNNNTLHLC